MNDNTNQSKILKFYHHITQKLVQDETLNKNCIYEISLILKKKSKKERYLLTMTNYRLFINSLLNDQGDDFLILYDLICQPIELKNKDKEKYFMLNNQDIIIGVRPQYVKEFQENLQFFKQTILPEEHSKAQLLLKNQNLNQNYQNLVIKNGTLNEQEFWQNEQLFQNDKNTLDSLEQKTQFKNVQFVQNEILQMKPVYNNHVFGQEIKTENKKPENLYEVYYQDDLLLNMEQTNQQIYERTKVQKQLKESKKNKQTQQQLEEIYLTKIQIKEQTENKYVKEGFNLEDNVDNLVNIDSSKNTKLSNILPKFDLSLNDGLYVQDNSNQVQPQALNRRIIRKQSLQQLEMNKDFVIETIKSQSVRKPTQTMDLSIAVKDYKRSFEITKKKREQIEDKEKKSLEIVRQSYSDIRRLLYKLYSLLNSNETQEIESLKSQLQGQRDSLRITIQKQMERESFNKKNNVDFIKILYEDLQKMIEKAISEATYVNYKNQT